MRSAVYEGTLRHRRLGPVRHQFDFPVAMACLDLDEIDAVFAHHRLWSVGRPNAASFRRSDFLGDPAVPLDVAVRDRVEASTGRRPLGPVCLLAHVRTWGWLFNPIAIYFCLNGAGKVEAVVLEVTNTPWHERHAYVVEGGEGEHRLGKELHVSPFSGMDQEYRLRFSEPGGTVSVHLASWERGTVVFEAHLDLRRREVSRVTLGRLLWRYPLLTLRVSAGIYWQALRLRAKGAPVHRHPAPVEAEATLR